MRSPLTNLGWYLVATGLLLLAVGYSRGQCSNGSCQQVVPQRSVTYAQYAREPTTESVQVSCSPATTKLPSCSWSEVQFAEKPKRRGLLAGIILRRR